MKHDEFKKEEKGEEEEKEVKEVVYIHTYIRPGGSGVQLSSVLAP